MSISSSTANLWDFIGSSGANGQRSETVYISYLRLLWFLIPSSFEITLKSVTPLYLFMYIEGIFPDICYYISQSIIFLFSMAGLISLFCRNKLIPILVTSDAGLLWYGIWINYVGEQPSDLVRLGRYFINSKIHVPSDNDCHGYPYMYIYFFNCALPKLLNHHQNRYFRFSFAILESAPTHTRVVDFATFLWVYRHHTYRRGIPNHLGN